MVSSALRCVAFLCLAAELGGAIIHDMPLPHSHEVVVMHSSPVAHVHHLVDVRHWIVHVCRRKTSLFVLATSLALLVALTSGFCFLICVGAVGTAGRRRNAKKKGAKANGRRGPATGAGFELPGAGPEQRLEIEMPVEALSTVGEGDLEGEDGVPDGFVSLVSQGSV